MTRLGISPGDVRSVAKLYRTRADCLITCELYEDGRSSEALLRSARPITDVLPWLENELRGKSEAIGSLTRSLGALGAAIRRAAPAADVRVAARRIDQATEEVAGALVGGAAQSPAFLASVVRELLAETDRAYQLAYATHRIDDYQEAQSALTAALEVLDSGGTDETLTAVAGLLGPFETALEDFDPPATLPAPGAINDAMSEIDRTLQEVGAASVDVDLRAEFRRISRLIDGVVDSYAAGQRAVAGRAAAHLFIHAYDPIRAAFALSDPDVEPAATRILGTDLRVKVNEGAPVEEVNGLAARALELLASAVNRSGDIA